MINNEKQSTTATTKKGFSRSHKGLEGLTALAEDYNDWNSVNNKPTVCFFKLFIITLLMVTLY